MEKYILLFFIGIVVWSVLMQRIAVKRQKQAMESQREAIDRQKEAMERQKEAMAQVEQSLSLNRKQVENQEKIITLLSQIRDGKAS
jgi:hypothetical protein